MADLEALPLSELLDELRRKGTAVDVGPGLVRIGQRELSREQRVGFYAVAQATLLGLLSPYDVGHATWQEVAQEALWRLQRHDRTLAVQMLRAAA